MIKRVIGYTLLACCFIAIILYGLGLRKVEIGSGFLAFLQNTNRELENYKIVIPDIPQIPRIQGIFVVAIDFLNAMVNVLNFCITLFNVAIQIIQFVVLLVKNFIVIAKNGWKLPTPFPYL